MIIGSLLASSDSDTYHSIKRSRLIGVSLTVYVRYVILLTPERELEMTQTSCMHLYRKKASISRYTFIIKKTLSIGKDN